MSSNEIAEARRQLRRILKLLIDSEEGLLGAMIIDIKEGLSLEFVPREEALESDVGPIADEEAIAGTLKESHDKIQELVSPDRLNLGKLSKVVIEGDTGIVIIQTLKEEAVLLLYGKKNTKIGFVYTLLNEVLGKIEEYTKKSISLPS
ncbi:MAG: hypothetical protein ACP6IQ_10945 [Candidatus Njordarchaeia archaeon]